jgi:hypothetical protein
VIGIGCAKSPSAPSALDAPAGGVLAGADVSGALGATDAGAHGYGSVGAQNRPPSLNLRTTPVAVHGDPYPVITGPVPLTVRFNLCHASDPDEGDSLNQQFHFGDGKPISAGPDFEHFCRAEHTYQEGTWIATVSVTDKHLEDQDDFSSLARQTQKVTIVATGNVGSDLGAPPPPSCSNTVSGRLETTGPTQLGRLFRNGIPSACPGKSYPGIFSSGQTNVYAEHAFTNPSSSTACVTVDFDPNSGANPCGVGAHASAYLGSYDAANQAANFLGDVGSSVTQPFAFDVPGGANFLVVVASNGGPVSCDFSFTVDNAACR